ncbi:hypothetical protein OAJ82_02080, partial [Alphaproteobacteria bacterium]|nr:hypothetical protein [Alphaproteobacteria bacterium]
IKFAYLSNKQSEMNKLFDKYSFLLTIFNHNTDLKNKFNKLSYTLQRKNWITFFLLEKKINSNELSNKFIIQEMKKINELSTDQILKEIITKKIATINDNI